MYKINETPTLSITIFNENGLLGDQTTSWYFDQIYNSGMKFDKISDETIDHNSLVDFRLYAEILDVIIYRGKCIIEFWGNTYDVLKMIVFLDSIIGCGSNLM
jgi:hypothetical protein